MFPITIVDHARGVPLEDCEHVLLQPGLSGPDVCRQLCIGVPEGRDKVLCQAFSPFVLRLLSYPEAPVIGLTPDNHREFRACIPLPRGYRLIFSVCLVLK